MNIEALCHIPMSNYAYAYKENELHIRLRTARDDMDQVNLIFSCKFDWYEKKQSQPMRKILTDQYYDYYQYEIAAEDTRIGYYFELADGPQKLYYTETGMVDEFNDAMAHAYYFQYPYINSVDVHKQPAWIYETVFYEIFVERFRNGDKDNSPPNLCGWEEEPKPKSFFGGDLKGIIEQLDYLSDLGINGLYLTPIFTSPSNHKYDIVNYFEIDPYFGNEQVLRELVEKAHQRGIRIILDAVFNHCSNQFPPFLDVVEKGKASEYFDWFTVDGDTINEERTNYRMFGHVRSMPKLNTANPKLKEYLLSCVRYWTEGFHIDGWRLDVSDEIDHKFWREFRTLVKSINQDAVIIGENWHNAFPWLMGDQFDSIMNYSVTKLCLDFFARKEIRPREFEQQLSTYLMRYPDQVNEALLNLLDSHDTERFLYMAKEDKKALKNAAAFLFAYKGMPCTYYGTEIGMTGGYDPGCRRGFDWRQENWDLELHGLYKRLVKVRKEEKALQYGRIEFLSAEQLFVMKRTYEADTVYILINNTKTDQVFVLSDTGILQAEELLRGGRLTGVSGELAIHVPPEGALYIKPVK